MKKNVFLKASVSVLLFFIFLHPSYSQSKSPREIASMEVEAKNYFHKFQFHLALKLYLQLDSIMPDNPKYIFPIGVCYVNEFNNEKALPYLEKCLENPGAYPRNLDYNAAKAYHLSHRFDEAIIHYEIYKHKLKVNKKNKALIEDTDREIEMCRNAKDLIAKPLDVKVTSIGNQINSPYPDYGPVLSADQQMIIFTSCRPNTTGGKTDIYDGHYYEDVYISYQNDSVWTPPVQIGAGVNTTGHDASISVSPDGQKLLIYRYQNALIAHSSGDIFISRLKGKTWTQATKLSETINSKSWESSACFSADERIIYFASNKEDGSGGTDIYMVRKLPNGEWALPMNMGKKINTPYNEDSPFIHPDGKTLYFSSQGHKSMGGYDIFVSHYDEQTKEWSYPENVGYPINTAHDDIHFCWSADGRRVYFSSIRPEGNGDKDIYFADIKKETADVVVMKGFILDSLTKKPIEAYIKVFDSKTNEIIGVYNSNSYTGKYIITFIEGKNYNMTIEAESYKLGVETINISNVKEFEEVNKDILLSQEK